MCQNYRQNIVPIFQIWHFHVIPDYHINFILIWTFSHQKIWDVINKLNEDALQTLSFPKLQRKKSTKTLLKNVQNILRNHNLKNLSNKTVILYLTLLFARPWAIFTWKFIDIELCFFSFAGFLFLLYYFHLDWLRGLALELY